MSQIRPYSRHHSRRQGFTLIEILIAISLFLVLLTVILVPLNQAFKVFGVGRTSIALQNSADSTVKTIAAELRGAVAVYPNDDLPGVTDRAPYKNPLYASTPIGTCPGSACSNAPYMIDIDPTKTNDDSDPCANRYKYRVSNPARIDFLLPVRAADGSVESPVKPERYVVTYFARRLYTTDSYGPYNNPVVIYRAQVPYERDDGTSATGVNTTSTRYNATGCDSDWLRQIQPATLAKPPEPQITESNYAKDVDTVSGSLTLVTPRDMALNVINPTSTDPTKTMQPDLNFACEDTDGNGVIDRVTISLTLVQYDQGDGGRTNRATGEVLGQRVTATQVVNLPNARFGV